MPNISIMLTTVDSLRLLKRPMLWYDLLIICLNYLSKNALFKKNWISKIIYITLKWTKVLTEHKQFFYLIGFNTVNDEY